MQEGTQAVSEGVASAAGPTMLAPVWDAWIEEFQERKPSISTHTLVVGGLPAECDAIRSRCDRAWFIEHRTDCSIELFVEQLNAHHVVEHIIWLAPPSNPSGIELTCDGVIDAQEFGIIAYFRLVKALLRLGYGRGKLSWTVVTRQTQAVNEAERIDPTHASVLGFAGSLSREQLKWKIRLVDLPGESEFPVDELFGLPEQTAGDTLTYRRGQWFKQRLRSCEVQLSGVPAYRHGGTYVIAGGAGGLGEVLSNFLAENYRANLFWLGRRELDVNIQAKIDRCSALGSKPVYIRTDSADRNSLMSAHREIKKQHSQVHGVIHSAIVLRDGLVNNLTEERLRETLAAKVAVSVRLAQIFGVESLDFLLFFSSILSFFRPPGQSSYVAGCAFKDAYANALARKSSYPIRVMNWGYWGDTGIVSTRIYRERMKRQGFGSIEPTAGMRALDALLGGAFEQLSLLQISNQAKLPNLSLEEVARRFPDSNSKVELEQVLAPVRNISRELTYADAETAATALPQELLLKLMSQQLRKLGLDRARMQDSIYRFPALCCWDQRTAS